MTSKIYLESNEIEAAFLKKDIFVRTTILSKLISKEHRGTDVTNAVFPQPLERPGGKQKRIFQKMVFLTAIGHPRHPHAA